MTMEPTTLATAAEMQRRVLVLGRAALEGSRPLSDLLGEAVAELRASLAAIQTLEGELQRAREQISDLGRELESARRGRPEEGHERPAFVPVAGRNGATVHGDGAGANGGAFRKELVDLFEPEVPGAIPLLEDSLRARFSGALYLGTLGAGDRLPSIRDLCRRTGLNHKVVRRVYRALEVEGVVEVRDRSGIFLSESDSAGTLPLEGLDEWVAALLADAVQRDLGTSDLLALLLRSLSGRTLSAACVDSTEDDRFGLHAELQGRFGFTCTPVDPRDNDLERRLEAVDVVVTTPFHAEEVRRRLPAGSPLVVARLHPDWRDHVAAHAGDGALALLCVDRSAGDRIRQSFGAKLAPALRVVTVDEIGEGEGEALHDIALATHAALDRLHGLPVPGSIAAPRYLDPASVMRIARLTVRLNRSGG